MVYLGYEKLHLHACRVKQLLQDMGAPYPVTRPFVSSSVAVVALADEEARVSTYKH